MRQRQAGRRPSIDLRERSVQDLARGVVRPEPLRNGPSHHEIEALPDAARLVHRGPDRLQNGEQVRGRHRVHPPVPDAAQRMANVGALLSRPPDGSPPERAILRF